MNNMRNVGRASNRLVSGAAGGGLSAEEGRFSATTPNKAELFTSLSI